MKGWRGTTLKLAFVAALMWWVLRSVHFEDRIVTYRGEQVVAEETIAIRGHWKADPVRYTVPGGDDERTIRPGPREGGLDLAVEPGFVTYWLNLDVFLFVCGALCFFATMLMSGTRWWWLLRVNGTDVSLLETLRFTWIGVFFNTVMPGSTGGDLIKALYIMKRCPGHRVQVLVSVVVDRVIGLASLALLGAVVVLFALDRFTEVALGIWGVIGVVAIVGVVAFSRRLRRLFRIKALLERLPAKVSHLLKMVDQAVFFYRNHLGVITASMLGGVVIHVFAVFSVALIGDALGIGMPWFEYFVLVPVINIVSALPIAPNGWGIGEFLYKQLFAKYGAGYLAASIPDAAQAAQAMGVRGFALSVLYRLHLTFWSLLGGLFVLFEKDRVTKADIEREVQLEDREDRNDANLPAP